jgi:NTE family protein
MMDIAVALGGGGARGNAHIGVLRVLEREDFNIRAVAGTSFGGIVAGVYAAGYSPDEIEELFSEVEQENLYGRLPNDGPALLGTAGLHRWLDEVFGERTFSSLKISCAMVAVDLNSGTEIILRKGRLKDAILATTAVPGIFPPYQIKDLELVDGGVMNPVPVSVVRELAPHLPVVAVVLSQPPAAPSHLLSVPVPSGIPAPLFERLARLRISQAFQIFMESVEIGNRLMTELRLKSDNPEVIIRPHVTGIQILDKVNVHDVITMGEEAAEAALPAIRRAVSWPSRLGRFAFRRN